MTNKQNAQCELNHLNGSLEKQGLRAILMTSSKMYNTYNIGVVVVALDNNHPDVGNWYYHGNKKVFKNWESCLSYILGMRKVLDTIEDIKRMAVD